MRSPSPGFLLLILSALASGAAYAQTATVVGYWSTPGGSVIRIASCGHLLCLTIARISPRIPTGIRPVTDIHNPDPRMRERPLCGLRIGTGFVEVDPRHARAGHVYDPKSGRTYSGEMRAEGNLLHLRGYVGLPIFGRTETWTRAAHPPPC